jgi:hypothetical protein
MTGYGWWMAELPVASPLGLASPLLPSPNDVRLGHLPARCFVDPAGQFVDVEGLFQFVPDSPAPFPWLFYLGNVAPRRRPPWRSELETLDWFDLRNGTPGVNAPTWRVTLSDPVPDGHGCWIGSRVWSSGRLPNTVAIGPVERAVRGTEEVARVWARLGWSGRVFWDPPNDVYARVLLDPLLGPVTTTMPGVSASTTIADVIAWWNGQGVTAARLTGSVSGSTSHRVLAPRVPVALTEGVQPLLMWRDV